MRFKDRYPIIVTPHKDAARDFWVRQMGLQVGFDSSWFVWLHSGDGSLSLAFMAPDHPSAPPGPEPFSGVGMCFELEVDDVDALHREVKAAGVAIEHPLTDEPFGQRRFGFRDPAGLWVDVVQQIEPVPGFWDRYLNEAR